MIATSLRPKIALSQMTNFPYFHHDLECNKEFLIEEAFVQFPSKTALFFSRHFSNTSQKFDCLDRFGSRWRKCFKNKAGRYAMRRVWVFPKFSRVDVPNRCCWPPERQANVQVRNSNMRSSDFLTADVVLNIRANCIDLCQSIHEPFMSCAIKDLQESALSVYWIPTLVHPCIILENGHFIVPR